jgi:hypothetical protein
MTLELSGQIFKRYSNTKFRESLSNGSQVVLRGRADRRTAMTTLLVAFRSFAKAPKKKYIKRQPENFLAVYT